MLILQSIKSVTNGIFKFPRFSTSVVPFELWAIFYFRNDSLNRKKFSRWKNIKKVEPHIFLKYRDSCHLVALRTNDLVSINAQRMEKMPPSRNQVRLPFRENCDKKTRVKKKEERKKKREAPRRIMRTRRGKELWNTISF